MTFKKAEIAKTLRNGLSMIEMNPLNLQPMVGFRDFVGVGIATFSKTLLSSLHS
jgi:hypothetical protein